MISLAEVTLPEKEETLPSNSYKDRALTKPKTVEAVVKGKVKKKSSFAELFLSEDRADIGDYVVKDVVIPRIKETIFDVIMGSLSMALFGGRHAINKNVLTRQGVTSKVNYSAFSNNGGIKASNQQPGLPRRADLDVSGVVFDDKDDAETVLGTLAGMVIDYGQVTVADFYALAEMDYDFTLGKWGWYKDAVMAAKVCPTRGGWYIEIAKAGAL